MTFSSQADAIDSFVPREPGLAGRLGMCHFSIFSCSKWANIRVRARTFLACFVGFSFRAIIRLAARFLSPTCLRYLAKWACAKSVFFFRLQCMEYDTTLARRTGPDLLLVGFMGLLATTFFQRGGNLNSPPPPLFVTISNYSCWRGVIFCLSLPSNWDPFEKSVSFLFSLKQQQLVWGRGRSPNRVILSF